MALKRVLKAHALIFFAVLCLLFTACASSNNGGGSTFKSGPGVDTAKKTITLGIFTPLSGPVAAPIGIPLTNGIKVFFDYVNKDLGGIDGYQVVLNEQDSKYDPQTQAQEYQQIHNDIAMVAESLGTPTTTQILPLANADHMLISAATLASSLAREKYVVLVGTPYRLQVENAFDYVVNKLGKTAPKTGIIYQNDDYGQDGLQGYKEAVTAYKLTDVGQLPYGVSDTDFTSQVAAMKSAGAEYVFLTTLPTVTAKIIGTAAALGYSPQWILQSPAYSPLLLGVQALVPLLTNGHVWIVAQGANWGDTSKPGMAELLQNLQKYAPDQKPDGFFEFGYTEAKITYAILKKAFDNKDVTRDGIFNAFNSLGDVDLGGLYPKAHYGSSPNDRVPTRDNTIYAIDPTQPLTTKDISGDFTGTAAQASNF